MNNLNFLNKIKESNILFFEIISISIIYLLSGIAISELLRFYNSNWSIHVPYNFLLNCFAVIIPVSSVFISLNWLKDWNHRSISTTSAEKSNQFYSRKVYLFLLFAALFSYSYSMFLSFQSFQVLATSIIENNEFVELINNYIPGITYLLLSSLIVTLLILYKHNKYLFYFISTLYTVNFILYWKLLLISRNLLDIQINSISNISYFQSPIILLFILIMSTLAFALSNYLFKYDNLSELTSIRLSIKQKGSIINLVLLAGAQSSLFIGLFL